MSEVMYLNFDTKTLATRKDFETNPKVCAYTDNMIGVNELFDEIVNWFKTLRFMTIDIETSRADGRPFKKTGDPPNFQGDTISCVQFSDGNKTYLIKNTNIKQSDLRPLMVEAAKVPWIGQNLKFDMKFIYRDYKLLPPLVFDTEIAAKCVYAIPERSYNLQTLVQEHLGMYLSKEEQISNWGGFLLSYDQIAYAAKDAYYTHKLFEVLVTKLNNLTESYTKNKNSEYIRVFNVHHKLFHLEMELLPIFTVTENYGVYLNMPEVEKNYREISTLSVRLTEQLIQMGGKGLINPSSPSQMLNLIRDKYPNEGRVNELGQFEAISNVDSTNKNVLKFFRYQELPLVDKLCEFKELTGNVQRLEEFLEGQVNSRIFPDFRIWGTITGRFSCKKPNLQNMKKAVKGGVNLRALFTAPPGKKLVVCDLSQIQLVIIAAMTGDPVMKDVICNGPTTGLDLHIMTAAKVNNIDPSQVTKVMRNGSKSINFGYCVVEDTLIVTSRGLVPVQDVKVGDFVLTHKGNWQPVEQTFSRVVEKVTQLTTRTGKVATSTPEHLWRIQNPSANGKPAVQSWLEAEDFKLGQYLVSNTYEHKHPSSRLFEDSNIPTLLGWGLSDGVLVEDLVAGGCRLKIRQSLERNPAEFTKMENFLTPLGYEKLEMPSKDSFEFISPVIEDPKTYFKGVQLPTHRHQLKDRNFSSIVQGLSREEKLELLSALWEGDGCVTNQESRKAGIGYYSVSAQLIQDIKLVLESLGLVIKVYNEGYTTRNSTCYILRIAGSESIRKFLDLIRIDKTSRIVYAPKKQFAAEESIEKIETLLGSFNVYDLRVAEDHSFIANGLVSHNCFGMGAKAFTEYALLQYDTYYDVNQAKYLRNSYFDLYKKVKEWHEEVQASRRGNKYYTKSFYGREVWAYNFTDATNYPVQAAEALMVKLALVCIERELVQKNLRKYAQLVNTVHDEVIYETTEEVAEEVLEIVEKQMVSCGELVIEHRLPVRVEGHVANSWYEGK